MLELSLAREEFFRAPLRPCNGFRHPSQQLDHLRQMIIVPVEVTATLGVEQQVSSHKLKDEARHRPNISRCIVLLSHNDFGTSVLPRLDVVCEVFVRPASVAEVAHLRIQHHNVEWLRSSNEVEFRLPEAKPMLQRLDRNSVGPSKNLDTNSLDNCFCAVDFRIRAINGRFEAVNGTLAIGSVFRG